MKSSHSNRRGVIVGIFILLGIAIFVITVLTLGGQKKTFQSSLAVKAIFDDVEGLQKGNNIWFSGVKIGTVKKISFYGSAQVEVELSIQESSQEYIRRDAKAKIGSDGLIGSRIVVIYGGTDKAPPIQEGDVLEVEKAVTTDEMLGTLQKNNKNLLDITTDIKNITAGLTNGQGTLGKLLSDETMMVQMQQVLANLRNASQNTNRITNSFADYAAQLRRRGTLANDLVTDTVLFSRLRATTRQIEAMSDTATAVVSNLRNASQNINESLNSQTTPIGVLLNDRQAASQLRNTLSYLNAGSKKLDENLEALQHNFLLRGFFRKKAEREYDSIKQAWDKAMDQYK